MRRVWTILASASLVLAWGCDTSYKYRMETTLGEMKYRKRLDDNLMPAATKDRFEELLIYVRPPKELQPAKEFMLPLPEPGKFDLQASFLETPKAGESFPSAEPPPAGGEAAKPAPPPAKQSLHVLARVKRPKNPAAKKKEAEPSNRGDDFKGDVLALLGAGFAAPPTDLALDKYKETTKKKNTFRHHSFAVRGKNIQVYFYGVKTDPYEVALIFEYPSTEHSTLYSKIELCLESFAVGLKAKRAFSGTVGEEPPAGAPAPAPGVF